jgi:GNAT superfamily N-acetyltransferase
MSNSPNPTWRPVADGDLDGIVALAEAVNAAEQLDFAGGPEFWKWWLNQHDLATDVMVVEDDGRIVGISGSFGSDTDSGARAVLWFDQHPEHPELEAPLLRWAIDRGRAQVEAAAHPEKAIRVSAEEHRDRRRRLLEGHGFREARTFVEMERTLAADLPDDRPDPDGITVVAWTPDLDEPARLVSNAAFADHWGSLPIDPGTWSTMIMDDETVRRDLSFVALAGEEPVAICMAEVDPEDDPDKLWIQRVGVRPEWQRRGLASLLISRSLHGAAGAGLQTAALDADEQSDFDATAIYTALGFAVTQRSVTYLMEDPE